MIRMRNLVAALIVIVVGIIACDTYTTSFEIRKELDNPIKLSDQIGKYHNIALDDLLKNKHINRLKKDLPGMREAIIQNLSRRDSAIFDKQKLLSKSDMMHQRLKKTGLVKSKEVKNKKGNNIKITYLEFDYLKLYEYMREEGVISDNLFKSLESVYVTHSDGGITDSLFKSIKQNLNESVESDKEQKVVTSFLEVLKASDKFWSNYSSGTKKQNLCGLATIWVDAAGAAYGSIGGPIWSIIEGALFSTFSHMYCETGDIN